MYEEVRIEDMDWDENEEMYTYECPCGDKFFITLEDLADGEDIAHCPSCSLLIRVLYNPKDFEDVFVEDDDASGVGGSGHVPAETAASALPEIMVR